MAQLGIDAPTLQALVQAMAIEIVNRLQFGRHAVTQCRCRHGRGDAFGGRSTQQRCFRPEDRRGQSPGRCLGEVGRHRDQMIEIAPQVGQPQPSRGSYARGPQGIDLLVLQEDEAVFGDDIIQLDASQGVLRPVPSRAAQHGRQVIPVRAPYGERIDRLACGRPQGVAQPCRPASRGRVCKHEPGSHVTGAFDPRLDLLPEPPRLDLGEKRDQLRLG